MQHKLVRAGVFVAAAAPFLWLVYLAASNQLGPDPARDVLHFTGEWSLRLLAITLCLSPLRQSGIWRYPFRFRRMLGLYAFYYATIHLVGFAQLYVDWDGGILIEELVERPYITAGFAAWVLMLPLAVTSTRGWQRRLGRRWVSLHRLVYAAALAGCLHLLWQARSDIGEALVYGAIFALLLGWRIWRQFGPSESGKSPLSGGVGRA
jgi:sulfoxide reductase heme-binding subunit YedZ